MDAVYDFDLDAPLAADGPEFDLDEQLHAQFPTQRVESIPLHTERVGDAAVTIVRVSVGNRVRHQVYSVSEDSWALVAIWGNYCDALSEVLRWRRYLSQGGSVVMWILDHPDGIYPETRGL
jgi:hypothetical protein